MKTARKKTGLHHAAREKQRMWGGSCEKCLCECGVTIILVCHPSWRRRDSVCIVKFWGFSKKPKKNMVILVTCVHEGTPEGEKAYG